jgi:hypothetical protein
MPAKLIHLASKRYGYICTLLACLIPARRATRVDPLIEIFEPQNLSIVCFRYTPPILRQDAQAIDRLNQAILEKLQLDGQAFLSSTVLDGRFWLRACIINPRTREEDLEEFVPTLASSAHSAIADEHEESPATARSANVQKLQRPAHGEPGMPRRISGHPLSLTRQEKRPIHLSTREERILMSETQKVYPYETRLKKWLLIGVQCHMRSRRLRVRPTAARRPRTGLAGRFNNGLER